MDPAEIVTMARTDRPEQHAAPIQPAPARAVAVPAMLPNGEVTAAYVDPSQLAALMAAAYAGQPAPATDTRVSGRAKSVALVSVSGGVGIGAATTGIGYGAGMVAANSAGLMTAAIATAIGAGSITLAALLLRYVFGGLGRRLGASASTGSQPTATHVTHITQNVTATGPFGRANGTINNR
jgi:hypothetical protein